MTELKKTYAELISYLTFEDRLNYLRCDSKVGVDTFGFDRYLNQMLYKSKEWELVRYKIILRDNGCDLGLADYEILDKAYVHHINPITPEDIKNANPIIFDPENLITVSFDTHNAIHYGIEVKKKYDFIERHTNDMCPWRKQ